MLPVPLGQVANNRLIVVEVTSGRLPVEPSPVLIICRLTLNLAGGTYRVHEPVARTCLPDSCSW